MEILSTSIPSIFGAPLLCDDENGMVVYSINDLDNNKNRDDDENSGDPFCQRISSGGMIMMMADPQQRSFGIPLETIPVQPHDNKKKNVEDYSAPSTTSRRGDRSARIRERKTAGSLQILSPVVVHHNKTAVKRKETRRSCFRHTSATATSSLRASSYGGSDDELDSPRMALSNKSTISKNACIKKVVRFCDEMEEEEEQVPIKIRSLVRYRHNSSNKHRSNS